MPSHATQILYESLEQKILIFSLVASIVVAFASVLIYLYYAMYPDAAISAGALGFLMLLFGVYRRQWIGFHTTSRLFLGIVLGSVLGGYSISSAVADGLIYIFVPSMSVIILRPKYEAIGILILYYALFFAINFFHWGATAVTPYQLLLILVIDALGLYFLYLYVDSNHALRQHMVLENRSLVEETVTDAMTGIFNRKAFDAKMQTYFDTFEHHERYFVFALIDIDHFKQVNDTHGHDTGDTVLQEVAQLLHSALSPKDFLSRYGGEEFAILLDNHGLQEGIVKAEKIRQRIAQNSIYGHLNLTVSIGLSIPLPNDTPQSLFKRADQALYRAKREGRNRVAYTPIHPEGQPASDPSP